jgi:hypothetical protein
MITQMTGSRRKRAVAGAVGAVLAVAVFAFAACSPGTAEQQEPPPIDAVPLTPWAEFTDDVAVQVRDEPEGRQTDEVNLRDASRLVVVEVTIQPGAMFPWHIHPGPVLVAVKDGDEDGAFTFIYADDCVERPYEVGDAFVDPGDSVHMAFNPSGTHATVLIATFLGVPEHDPDDPGTALTQPIDDGDALDDECGIDRGAGSGHNGH